MRLIDGNDLEAAVEAGILDRTQYERLKAFVAGRTGTVAVTEPAVRPARFDFSHVLWYAGAVIIIGAMGMFTTLAFAEMGGKALTVTAVIYAAIAMFIAHRLWGRPGLRVPAGLLVAVAVSMTPMGIYGIQASYDLWPEPFSDPGNYKDFYEWLNASWIYMDAGTVIVGIIALRFYPFPFIAAIMALALWFMSMDLTPWFYRGEDWGWDARQDVSLWFGLALIIVAWGLDLRKWAAGDFAFWLHLCGIVTFWSALSLYDSDSEAAKAIYCLMNAGLVFLSVFLMRRVYSVFGAFGIAAYLEHLADDIFADSILFPVALSCIGLLVIGAGIVYFRRRDDIAAWLNRTLPAGAQKLRPAHARLGG